MLWRGSNVFFVYIPLESDTRSLCKSRAAYPTEARFFGSRLVFRATTNYSNAQGPSAPIQQHVYSSLCCRYTPDREIIALPASTTSIPSCYRFVQKQQEHLIAAVAMSLDPVMPPFNSSDPSANFLSSSCLDFLLIELVPLAYRVTNERDSTQDPSEPAGAQTAEAASTSHRGTSLGSGGAHHVSSSGTRKLDDEEELDAVHFRLESLGYRVGQGLVERYVSVTLPFGGGSSLLFTLLNSVQPRFSRDRPRFNDTLDVIKFLCKDLWSLVFGKNIDNLKTNHRVRLSSQTLQAVEGKC